MSSTMPCPHWCAHYQPPADLEKPPSAAETPPPEHVHIRRMGTVAGVDGSRVDVVLQATGDVPPEVALDIVTDAGSATVALTPDAALLHAAHVSQAVRLATGNVFPDTGGWLSGGMADPE